MRRLAVYAGLFAVAAAKSATEKSANAYSTANETVSGTPWRRKGGVLEEVGPGRLVLFGGKVKDPRANGGRAAYAGDAWLLTLARPAPGGAAWTPLSGSEPVGAAAPLSRWKACGAGVDGAFYLFGGGSQNGPKNLYFDDLWRLDLRGFPAWTRIEKKPVWPEARRGAWAAPVAGGFVVAGGRTRGHRCFRDAWTYRVATGSWTESATLPDPEAYPCRWGHTLTRVPATRGASPFPDGRAVETVATFGGRFLEPGEKKKSGAYVYLNDLWFYDPVADEWARGAVLGETRPPARDHHVATFARGGLYIHGGKLTDQAPKALGDLWRYDVAAKRWQELTPASGPSTRYLHGAAPWPNAEFTGAGQATGAVIVFGGEHIKSRKRTKKYDRMNDVWLFSPTTGNWTCLVEDALEADPNALVQSSAYLPMAGELVGGLVMALVLVAAVLHARFREDDSGGPLGVRSP
mmetsp:Transcript_22666/g.70077  ORF Transcript_22666/g.70077 Transcript_22666/m.70077 type:complete len:462 (+) Transcript_22666:233-1618(+)